MFARVAAAAARASCTFPRLHCRRVAAACAVGAASATLMAITHTTRLHARDTHLPGEVFERATLIRCAGDEEEMHRQYETLEFLGRGGFGTVMRARQRATGLLRAIKQVTFRQEPGMPQQNQLNEVEALMELDHPNVVRLYEYYEGTGRLYLVEENCSGGTLADRLDEKGGRLNSEEAAVVVRQILRGMLCCHAHGLKHRDLKPNNLVWGSRDPKSALKLIDFGLSLGSDHVEVPRSYVQILTGELLVDLERQRSSTADFMRMFQGMFDGIERSILDDAARVIRSNTHLSSRMALARQRAPAAACDLLEQMLQPDPDKRITVAQALRHPFIQESYLSRPRGGGVFDPKIIPKMRRFAELPPMHRLAVLVEAHLLGPQDDDAIRQGHLSFRAADEQGLGVLTAADIAYALQGQGEEVPEDLPDICNRIDANQDGSVHLLEFIAATMEPRLTGEPRLCKVPCPF